MTILHHSQIHLQFLRVSLSCEQNAFPFCCRNKQRIFTIIKQAVPEIHDEGDEVRFGILNVKLCFFDLNFSIRPVKKFVVYK